MRRLPIETGRSEEQPLAMQISTKTCQAGPSQPCALETFLFQTAAQQAFNVDLNSEGLEAAKKTVVTNGTEEIIFGRLLSATVCFG